MFASPTTTSFFPISTFLVHSPSFFKTISRVCSLLIVANAVSCVGRQNELGQPARRHTRLMKVLMLSALRIGSKTCVICIIIVSQSHFCYVWFVLKTKSCQYFHANINRRLNSHPPTHLDQCNVMYGRTLLPKQIWRHFTGPTQGQVQATWPWIEHGFD